MWCRGWRSIVGVRRDVNPWKEDGETQAGSFFALNANEWLG
jgi:hypothetical protein